LIENAYDSLAESLGYVEKAASDPSRWKFAVLNLVHAVELVLKQRLYDEHELLIWQDVDRPGKLTVGLEKAIQRLAYAKVAIDEADVQGIETAIRWRNNITHYEVDLIAEEVRENYLLIFEFLDKFHEAHFTSSLSDRIPDEHVQTSIDLTESFKREFIEFRGRQMHRSWPKKLRAAQDVTSFSLDGKVYPRVAWGQEPGWRSASAPAEQFCHDCETAPGEYHGPGCDMEVCPKEFHQLLMCDCEWDPSDLWDLDADAWLDSDHLDDWITTEDAPKAGD
jgi:hypothetical protein